MNLNDLFSTPKRVVVFDVESKHFADDHRIVEFAYVDLQRPGSERRFCHKYVNPDQESQPDFRSEAIWLYLGLNDSVVVSHNASFDQRVVESEFDRQDFQRPNAVWIDSLAFADQIYPKQENGLDALATRLGVCDGDRESHSALDEVKDLNKVLMAMGQSESMHDAREEAGTEEQKVRTAPSRSANGEKSEVLKEAFFMAIGFAIYGLVIFSIVRYFF